MTIRKIALSSVAAAGLFAVVGTMPAFAFTNHPATPQENAQTDALNAQSLAAAQASQTPAAAPLTDKSALAATPAPAQGVAPGTTSPMPVLSAMQSPPASLTNTPVETSTGVMIGSVKNVVVGADGKASMVNVMLADNQKTVSISATELSYDSVNNILMASLSGDQIKALPPAAS